jgi:hypothetical protein
VGKWVAYPVNYTDEFPENRKQAFWVARIVEIDVPGSQVYLKTWHTTCVKNLTTVRNPKYKEYNGKDDEYWISTCDVLEVFQLTDAQFKVPEPMRKKIKNALILRDTLLQAAGGDHPVGVGADSLENPRLGDDDSDDAEHEYDDDHDDELLEEE